MQASWAAGGRRGRRVASLCAPHPGPGLPTANSCESAWRPGEGRGGRRPLLPDAVRCTHRPITPSAARGAAPRSQPALPGAAKTAPPPAESDSVRPPARRSRPPRFARRAAGPVLSLAAPAAPRPFVGVSVLGPRTRSRASRACGGGGGRDGTPLQVPWTGQPGRTTGLEQLSGLALYGDTRAALRDNECVCLCLRACVCARRRCACQRRRLSCR